MKTRNNKPKMYIAAPLFSIAELQFNVILADRLSAYFDVFLPQRDGGLMDQMIKAGTSPAGASTFVFEKDLVAIQNADLILAVLDGRAIDEGVAVELGISYALSKPCFGIQTGPIRLLASGNNPMISNILEATHSDFKQLDHWAKSFTLETNDTTTNSSQPTMVEREFTQNYLS